MNIKRAKHILTLFLMMAGLFLAVRFALFSGIPVAKAGGGNNWLQFSFDQDKDRYKSQRDNPDDCKRRKSQADLRV